MRFAVAPVAFWEAHGFDTRYWRKSVDETYALVHDEFARRLVPDLQAHPEVQVYQCPGAALDELLESPAWSPAE
ncbi:MAG: hypothetical protein ACLSAP_08730 [Oscillospiraceae bacterium]